MVPTLTEMGDSAVGLRMTCDTGGLGWWGRFVGPRPPKSRSARGESLPPRSVRRSFELNPTFHRVVGLVQGRNCSRGVFRRTGPRRKEGSLDLVVDVTKR